MTYGKRGIFVRITYVVIAMLFFAISKIRGATRRGKIILCYHGVKTSQKYKFANQMRMIKNRVISSRELESLFNQDSGKLLICLTFDDAFANLLLNVIPLITERQIPITIFIPVGSCGTFPSWLKGSEDSDSLEMVMSVNQILNLKENSMVNFGSHTVDHPQLSLLNEEKIREQLRSSRNLIAKIIGNKISELALPHGDCNEIVVRVALEEGYRWIYTLDPVIYSTENTRGAHLVGRFSVSPDDWPIEFYLTINGAYTWLVPWRSFLRKMRK